MDINKLLCATPTTAVPAVNNPLHTSTNLAAALVDDIPLYPTNAKSPEPVYHPAPVCWSSTSSVTSATSVKSPAASSYYSTPSSPLAMTPPSSPSTASTVPNNSSMDNTTPSSQRRSKGRTTQTRTPWTPKEDYLLQQGYAQGLSWAMISSNYLPHRSRGCCWGRFKTLQTKSVEQREWSEAEDRLLHLVIKKHSRLFKQAWKSVAGEMGSRHWRECELRSIKLNHQSRKRQTPQA